MGARLRDLGERGYGAYAVERLIELTGQPLVVVSGVRQGAGVRLRLETP